MITVGLLALSIAFAGSTKLLTPGHMATPHGSIRDCKSCHSGVPSGPVGWVHSIFATADPRKDSMACLTCHNIEATAINPHSASMETLELATNRLRSAGADSSDPIDRLREAMFPVRQTFRDGVFCQTCHKEHQGEKFDLQSMSDNRCQACHTAKIHSFADDHPAFGQYPFKRRTRIVFDHTSHINKHFPDQLAKQATQSTVPAACGDCHTIASDNRHMDLKPFNQVCSSCHLGQIVGTERLQGPQGIAFLTLPGLDVETLEEKGADIGEWPSESDALPTPFMALLIGRDAKRKKMLSKLNGVDLLELSDESDETIAAVREFAWEIKDLLHTYTKFKPSVVLDRLHSVAGQKIDPELLTRLVASMPRDVLMGAQRQWLPNLASELEEYRGAQQTEGARGTVTNDPSTQSRGTDETDDTDAQTQAPAAEPQPAVDAEAWTEFGGWYRLDYSILYKPTGHMDEFLQAWLDLSGKLFNDTSDDPATSVFKLLTTGDAQGRCVKCHSVDSAENGARKINWMPFKPSPPAGRFTEFSHSPHLAVVGNQGCLACHKLNPSAKNQATYKQLNPTVFESNFFQVSKKDCASCHVKGATRDDCLLCHNYHVNQVTTPFPVTNLPGD